MLAPIAKSGRKAKDVLVRILRITAWVVALTTCAIFAGLVLGLGPDLTDDERWAYPFAFVALAPAIVGLLIAIRQPRNVIAWILLVGSVSSAPWYIFIPDEGWSLQFSRAMWPLLYAWPIAVTYVFPNGRLLTRRWRWVAGGAIFSFVAFMTVAMFDTDPFDPPRSAVHNPMAGVHHPALARLDLGAVLDRHAGQPLRRGGRDPPAAAPLVGCRAAADALDRLGGHPDSPRPADLLRRLGHRHSLRRRRARS